MKYEQTAVGDKYVYENMLKNGYILGGDSQAISFSVNMQEQATASLPHF